MGRSDEAMDIKPLNYNESSLLTPAEMASSVESSSMVVVSLPISYEGLTLHFLGENLVAFLRQLLHKVKLTLLRTHRSPLLLDP